MIITKQDECENHKCGVVIYGDVTDYRYCQSCVNKCVSKSMAIEMDEKTSLTIVSDEHKEMEIKHNDESCVIRSWK